MSASKTEGKEQVVARESATWSFSSKKKTEVKKQRFKKSQRSNGAQ